MDPVGAELPPFAVKPPPRCHRRLAITFVRMAWAPGRVNLHMRSLDEPLKCRSINIRRTAAGDQYADQPIVHPGRYVHSVKGTAHQIFGNADRQQQRPSTFCNDLLQRSTPLAHGRCQVFTFSHCSPAGNRIADRARSICSPSMSYLLATSRRTSSLSSRTPW